VLGGGVLGNGCWGRVGGARLHACKYIVIKCSHRAPHKGEGSLAGPAKGPRVWGLEFGVWGLGFWVLDLGLAVWGLRRGDDL